MDVTVLCFDRDMTVSVNFDSHLLYRNGAPPDCEPVPMSWVKHYAHAVDGVDVWATGNQHLRKEAAIPGMVEAHDLWEEAYDEDIESVYAGEGFGDRYKPLRRDGLRVIREIYEAHADDDSLNFVVIDDVDLTDMADEWGEHYYAWDFITEDEWAVDDPAFSDTPANSSDCDEDIRPSHPALDTLREEVDAPGRVL